MKNSKAHSLGFYVGIWVFLMLAIAASVFLSSLGHPTLATSLIFAIATLKALVVAYYYMGLCEEPYYVPFILIVGLLFVALFFVALIPDIIYIYGKP